MSNLAYHPKGLKVKKRLCRPGTKYPSSGVTTSDFGQLPLELTIVHPALGGWWEKGLRPGVFGAMSQEAREFQTAADSAAELERFRLGWLSYL